LFVILSEGSVPKDLWLSGLAQTVHSPYYRFSVELPKKPLPKPVATDPDRLVAATRVDDDQAFELKLRPNRLAEFIGQQKAKEQLAIALQAAAPEARRSTTSCSSDRPAWVKPPSPPSSPTSSTSASSKPPAPPADPG
jgi:hypothetical protein